MPECKALTNHMCISLNNSWIPCCRFGDKQVFDVNKITFEEFRRTNFFKKIKTDMKNGWSEGCNKCKSQEETTGVSYRNFFNENYQNSNYVEFIEISLSNKCNLSCRMCNPVYSSSWSDLLEKNKDLDTFILPAPKVNISIDKILSQIDLQHLKRIKYLGGEPFITPEIKNLFDYLDKHNIIGNLTLECNTNCTLFPQKYLHYLNKFKKIEISLSIDGIGKVNNFIRHGKSWEIVSKNIQQWIDFKNATNNTVLILFTTVQAYNFHDIKTIKKYARKNRLEFQGAKLTYPEYLSIDALPPEYIKKNTNSQNYEYVKDYNYNHKLFKEFKEFTNMFDKVTDTSYKTVIPQLEIYMEK